MKRSVRGTTFRNNISTLLHQQLSSCQSCKVEIQRRGRRRAKEKARERAREDVWGVNHTMRQLSVWRLLWQWHPNERDRIKSKDSKDGGYYMTMTVCFLPFFLELVPLLRCPQAPTEVHFIDI